jgi:RsiW-degrading membrane proteinase PrsW (M82 family)
MILSSLFLTAIGFNIWLVLVSILLISAFIYFLHKADIFDDTPLVNRIALVVFGALSTILTFPILFIFNRMDITVLGYGMFSDIIYCVIRIALVDEFVKAVPFLVLILFTSKINEPFDFLKYICLSALGYACLENLRYAYEYDTVIITHRLFFTALTQVFYSAVIAYIFMLNDYKYKRPQVIAAALGFGIAVTLHGTFYFLLVNNYFTATYGHYIAWAEAFIALVLLGQMFNTAISSSGFYTLNRQKLLMKAALQFVFALLMLFIISMLLVLVINGKAAFILFLKDNGFYAILMGLYTLSTVLALKFVKRATWIPVWDIKKAPDERN